ncbi:MAG: UDP-N-acetylmuramate dehydrogenase [Pseudomonadota bacterium]
MISKDNRMFLADRHKGRILFDEPMARHTTLRVGGPAEALIYPKDINEITDIIGWARKKSIPLMAVGTGSNLLVRDGGIQGIVVNLGKGFKEVRPIKKIGDTTLIMAEAGVSLSKLVTFAADHNLSGLTFAAGVPGTVGGAVRMNAGTATGCMGDVIDALTVLVPTGDVIDIKRDKLNFSYRRLEMDPKSIILKAYFKLGLGSGDALRKAAVSMLEQRRAKQPLSFPSAGSFFKNPATGPSAGKLIEEAGLKGYRVNDAQVSEKHANFIINRNKATAEDILGLVNIIQDSVYKKSGIVLEPEVVIVGEKTYT